uniref:G patch domain-containing protein 4 n=1 Tax=Sander lucioperca TaxID=283035 RepID=A0A8C9YKX6_SANLU
MADAVPEKSRALKFAEQQLLRHGWEHGKGLGRGENGISEAIKVKVKCGKGGVGHKEGEQFTFHWWDHVFNKASSGLQVESDQSNELTITWYQHNMIRGLFYCLFTTLLSGQEQPEPKSSSSDDINNKKRNLISDAFLLCFCRGARHGLTMSAKLARLEQQEAEFMAKYGKKSQPASAPTVGVTPASTTSQSTDQRAERQEETVEDSQRKKMKKKRATKSVHELNGDNGFESPGSDVKPKKKKEKRASEDTEEITDAVSTEGDLVCVENSEADSSHKTRGNIKEEKQSRAERRRTNPFACSRREQESWGGDC